ncbi:MAG: hypothetical protein RL410_1562 [Actinomycetota bacterium]
MNDLPFGFTPNEGQPFDMNSLGEMLQQIGQMMQRAQNDTSENGVSWGTIHDSARQAISAAGDPSITDNQTKSVTDAVALAQVWLDGVTSYPASSTESLAWSRSEWLEATLPAWRPLIEPVAAGLSRTVTQISSEAQSPQELEQLPPEMKAMLEPMLNMASKMAAVSTGMQVGQGLAALSTELLSSSEIAVPLSPDFVPALLPERIKSFADENHIPLNDAFVFIAVREAAIQRLFAANPWLRAEVADAVSSYARGISIDQDRIREVMSSIDPQDPASMQEVMSSGVFQPATTEDQQRALNRMELMLSLIEGWVNAVTIAAVGNRLGAMTQLIETMNRRRVSGGPAEKTFANLVGLEISARVVRAAAAFWDMLGTSRGNFNRDNVWAHPDFLPSRDDLDDPQGFISRMIEE